MNEADNKTVLITGCSSGIGQCLAARLHERGYDVIATCRNAADCSELADKGIKIIMLDLDHSESITHATEQMLKIANGRMYALINNGAYGQPGAVEDLSREALRKQFETNVFGTQELTNRIIPIMRKHGEGRIIQISSVLGFVCLKFRGAYNASKFALEALTDTMRLEFAGSNIKFSLVEPGPIASKFRQTALKRYIENINANDSYHKEAYENLEKRLKSDKPVKFCLPPEAVLKAVIHALESTNPKIRYRVTFPTKLFAPLKRLLPDRLMDKLLAGR